MLQESYQVDKKDIFHFSTSTIIWSSRYPVLLSEITMLQLVLVVLTKNNFTFLFVGSEIYQEILVKALTKHFDAKLLIVDSSILLGVSLLTIAKMLILWQSLTRATTAILKESTTSYI